LVQFGHKRLTACVPENYNDRVESICFYGSFRSAREADEIITETSSFLAQAASLKTCSTGLIVRGVSRWLSCSS
jgi:hypothetical protein